MWKRGAQQKSEGDEIVGATGAEIGDHYLGTDCLIATNYFLYVSRRLRGTALGGRVAVKLMRLFIDWAKANGVETECARHVGHRSGAGGPVPEASRAAAFRRELCGEARTVMTMEIGERVTAEGKRVIQALKIFLIEIFRVSLWKL